MTNNNTSRVNSTLKNIFWGNVGNVLTSLLSFISRTVFISVLGATYLGVNGLFSNILGLLSFTELGIGSAMNYSLYNPIAKNDTEKIKSLMQLYKRAYRIIAVVVLMLGLLILPFLDYFVSEEAHFQHLQIYYLIFLFNTVTSYLVTYKYAYLNAIQKEYIITNFNTVFTILLTCIQIGVLVIFKNFLVYLLVQSGWGIVQKIITVVYINRNYPILNEKNVQKLTKEDGNRIFSNVKALIIHKIGDVAVHQTDNIIISSFVSTTSVGLISNYYTLHVMVSKFSNTVFNSFVAGFGNMIVNESVQKQKKIFELYNFLGSWLFGFIAVCFITLADPFVELWIGKNMVLDTATMTAFFVSLYLASQTFPIYNFKVAAGIFNDDKYIAFVQACVNLVVSIVMVKLVGLCGVYIGTIVQRMIVVVFRPYIVYKKHLKKGLRSYYYYFFKDAAVTFGTCYILQKIRSVLYTSPCWIGFFMLSAVTIVISNLMFAFCNIIRIQKNGTLEYVRKLAKYRRKEN